VRSCRLTLENLACASPCCICSAVCAPLHCESTVRVNDLLDELKVVWCIVSELWNLACCCRLSYCQEAALY